MTERSSSDVERDIAETRARVSADAHAIQERLSPGQLMDEVLDYLRAGGGEFGHGASVFARNFGRSVRDNPVPVALIGTGLAWMMVAGGRRRHPRVEDYDTYAEWAAEREVWDAYDEGWVGEPLGDVEPFDEVDEEARHGGTEERGGFGERSRDAAGAAHERATSAAEAARERAASTSEAVHERASGAADQAREGMAGAAEGARHRFERAGAGARRGVGRARRGAGRGVRRMGDASRHGVDRAGARIGALWDDQPLVFGVLGVALGAVLAAALPASRPEDEWLGETRDDLRDRAVARGHEEFRKARRTGERAADAAMREAERQGMSQEAASERAREAERTAGDKAVAAEQAAGDKVVETGEKLREVGEAVEKAAKDEAERQDLGGGTRRSG